MLKIQKILKNPPPHGSCIYKNFIFDIHTVFDEYERAMEGNPSSNELFHVHFSYFINSTRKFWHYSICEKKLKKNGKLSGNKLIIIHSVGL